MSQLTALTCYYPNAAKLMPLGFEPEEETDSFGRRQYLSQKAMIAVDCAEGASGEVTVWRSIERPNTAAVVGRVFTGLLPNEAFFDQLLVAVGIL